MSEQKPIYTATPSLPVDYMPAAIPPASKTKLDPDTKAALVRYFVTMKKAAETMLNELER